MAKINRRTFISISALAALKLVRPNFLFAQSSTAQKRIVIYINAIGGFDAMHWFPQRAGDAMTAIKNTYRPQIYVPGATVLPIFGTGETVGLHPQFSRLAAEAAGNITLITGTGVLSRDPGRSHETCQNIISVGDPNAEVATAKKGWLARMMDDFNWNSFGVIGVGPISGKVDFLADEQSPIVVSSLANYRYADRNFGAHTVEGQLLTGAADSRYAREIGRQLLEGHSVSKAIDQSYQNALRSVSESEEVIRTHVANQTLLGNYSTSATPPSDESSYSQLQSNCRDAAKLVKYAFGSSENQTTFIYLQRGGNDTHADQVKLIAENISDLSAALCGLISDLKSVPGLWESSAIVISSEFGRTVRQNAPSASTGGTDHGWGSTQMVLGGSVQGKRIGIDPSLADLSRYNFIVPTISTFNPMIEALNWAGVQNASDYIKDGNISMQQLGIFS